MITKIIDFIRNNLFKLIVSFLLFLSYLFLCLIIYYLYTTKNNKEIKTINESVVVNSIMEEKLVEPEYIYVDVKGSVKKPNVYKLEKGSRTIDAIKIAGGLSKNANTRFINLSKILNDGDVIVIYSSDEIKKAQKTNTIVVETPCVCEEIKNDSCYNENNNQTNSGLVNINTASLDQLLTLTGIGEAKAKAIIEYRQSNGNFNVIEDITKVSGISETIFSKIKNYITV